MEITENQIKKSIHNLYDKINYPISSIYNDKNLFFDYSIVTAANNCSDDLNIYVHNTIKSLFRPQNIINDTFGAFLFGSHIDYYGDIPKECSPIYLGSLFDNFNKPYCSKQVWIRKNKNNLYKFPFSSNNERIAYLFTDDNPFTLTSTEKDILNSNGINEVHLLYYDNGIYKEYSKVIITQNNECNKQELKKIKKKKHINNEFIEGNNSYLFLIFVLFIILIIFGIMKFKG